MRCLSCSWTVSRFPGAVDQQPLRQPVFSREVWQLDADLRHSLLLSPTLCRVHGSELMPGTRAVFCVNALQSPKPT